ncbi:hypothetical protein R1flu_002392 [Riccia fluitans]|uniref:Uncharacterized protein n=1 Tax=Riccia fluitans TaxID=41844 RepID=A0ABD1Y9B9_9MARC
MESTPFWYSCSKAKKLVAPGRNAAIKEGATLHTYTGGSIVDIDLVMNSVRRNSNFRRTSYPISGALCIYQLI